MATAEKRFHVSSEEEINKLLTDKDRINTQKSTLLSVKCFREQDPDKVEFEEFSLENLKFEKHSLRATPEGNMILVGE
jgi:hypothetical protein